MEWLSWGPTTKEKYIQERNQLSLTPRSAFFHLYSSTDEKCVSHTKYTYTFTPDNHCNSNDSWDLRPGTLWDRYYHHSSYSQGVQWLLSAGALIQTQEIWLQNPYASLLPNIAINIQMLSIITSVLPTKWEPGDKHAMWGLG